MSYTLQTLVVEDGVSRWIPGRDCGYAWRVIDADGNSVGVYGDPDTASLMAVSLNEEETCFAENVRQK